MSVESEVVCQCFGGLVCPRCGDGELFRREGKVNGERVMTVVFKCFFAATFEEGLTDQEMQRRLDQLSNLED